MEHRRERQPLRLGDARGIVEQLAQEELHAARAVHGPRHEAFGERVEPRGPGPLVALERERERGLELVADLVEDSGIELLLLREVVDHRGKRKASLLGDVTHARAMKAAKREQALGSAEDGRSGTGALGRVGARRRRRGHESRTSVP